MYVVGTAGHVDHGKSALVEALTGIDPDRLREEKQRGLTIDLGFAWCTLPSGREVSIVDVPGHERFVKNMLAGVGAVDLALLVVAADESVMPQTREHVAILDLLRIPRGLVALTKRDLADEEMLQLVEAEVGELLAGTTLRGAPVIPVSSTTREGLPALADAMDAILTQAATREDLGRPRLAVDRCFTVAGFGSVATGTLIDGSLRVVQELEVLPAGRRVRARGLQTHRRKVSTIAPGNRAAVNLSGASAREVTRGDLLAAPGWITPTGAVDVQLRLVDIAPHPLRHNTVVTLHAGTAERMARVRLLDNNRIGPGEEAWAQVKLAEPLALVRGDFFVIRSAETTLGGGRVVEPHAMRHRRHHAPTLHHLEVVARGEPRDLLLSGIQADQPVTLGAVASRRNLSLEEADLHLHRLLDEGAVIAAGNGPETGTGDRVLYTAAGWERLKGQVTRLLKDHHARRPARRGLSREELRSRLGLDGSALDGVLGRLEREEVVAQDGGSVRIAGHRPAPTAEQRKRMDRYVATLREGGYAPPTELELEPDLVNLLAEDGHVVRVAEQLVFEAQAYREMVDKIVASARQRGRITVAEVRDLLGTSRKYVLPLMEHLDQRRVTRRVGDERVLRE